MLRIPVLVGLFSMFFALTAGAEEIPGCRDFLLPERKNPDFVLWPKGCHLVLLKRSHDHQLRRYEGSDLVSRQWQDAQFLHGPSRRNLVLLKRKHLDDERT